jgi:hypothetical protein
MAGPVCLHIFSLLEPVMMTRLQVDQFNYTCHITINIYKPREQQQSVRGCTTENMLSQYRNRGPYIASCRGLGLELKNRNKNFENNYPSIIWHQVRPQASSPSVLMMHSTYLFGIVEFQVQITSN